jgi:predicted RNA binding protein YcfA (HicA-like mRNA interferase family)
MKVRDLLKMLERDGWLLVRVKGSHRQFHHPDKQGTVTVSGHPSDDVHPGTLRSIRRQAAWEKDKP